MSYRLIRPLLFALPPDRAHSAAGAALRMAAGTPGISGIVRRLCNVSDPALEMDLLGIRFPNPLGLAAGYDKDARLAAAVSLLGLGFTEVGTVTPRPQSGNPRPWLFRLVDQKGMINRAGFNNEGAARMSERLGRLRRRGEIRIPVGINLGVNRDTPLERAASDYTACLELLYPHADYLVVNVSSPNTPGLRDLQGPDMLRPLLEEIIRKLDELRGKAARGSAVPLLLKISPDLEPRSLPEVVDVARRGGVAGFVATNTSSGREGLEERWRHEEGGLSGRPLRSISTGVIHELYRLTGGECPIIGVGGISGPEDAWEKIAAGASLLQIYTGLIYQGPGLPAAINRGLLRHLEDGGFEHLSEAVGTAHRAR